MQAKSCYYTSKFHTTTQEIVNLQGEGNYLVKNAGISEVGVLQFEILLVLQSETYVTLSFFKEKQTWKEG